MSGSNSDWTPYLILIVAAFFVLLGLIWISMGKAWVRFSGWVYRDREPRTFWGEVTMDFLVGIGFIVFCVYEVMKGPK